MSIVTDLEKVDTIALGGFDGMHQGHQALFKHLGKNGAIVVIETGCANLTPNRLRENYVSHPILYLDLKDIKNFGAKEFVTFLKQKFVNLKKIVVGYDFRFGKDRRYDAKELQALCKGDIVVVDEVKFEGVSVHSRVIREYIQKGNVSFANKLLGHNYTIGGELVKGQGIGKEQLFPTLNLEAKGFLLPKEGVYATFTRIDDEEHLHRSVSFVGHRVSTDGSFAVESHILDGEIECKEKVQISFVAFIRENKKFDSLKTLKEQIEKDIKIAQKELKMLAL